MIDEQELERQKFLAGWDTQSCAEFTQFLDEWHEQEAAEPPCECLQIDVDLFDNRNCPVHGRF